MLIRPLPLFPVLVAALAAFGARAAPHPSTVVVLPITGDAALADDLRAALTAFGATPLAKAATTQALASADVLGLKCAVDTVPCIVKLGGLAGGDTAIGGVVGADGAASLHLVDVAAGAERHAATATLPADKKLRAHALKLLVVRLLAPELERGAVAVHVAQKGATVVVDGIPRGTSPLPKALEVAPGKHEVFVALSGYASVVNQIDVAFDDTASLDVELKKGEGEALPAATLAPPPLPAPVAPAPVVEEPAAAKKHAVLRVAVYDFELSGIEPRIGRVVTDATVSELRKLQGLSVVGMDEVRAALDLEAQKQLTGCSTESCAAEIAEALGVDGIVIGQLAQVGDEKVFGMKRIEQKTAKALGQVQQRLRSESGEELLAMIGPAVEQLFPDCPLKPGTARGVSPELALRVNPPPLSPWVFWGGVAVTGSAVVTAGVAAGINLAGYLDATHYVSQKQVEGSELTGKDAALATSATTAYAALGTAAVAGAATVVVALFTDFNGYRGAE